MSEYGKIWMKVPEKTYLASPHEVHGELIRKAQNFTVSLKACVVSQKLDTHSGNDILVLTQSCLGNRPVVERVHFWEKDVKPGELSENIFAENVFLTGDYSGDERLWIKWVVMEIDTDDSGRKATIENLKEISREFGAAFPILAPYTGFSTLVIDTIHKLFNSLRRDTHVLSLPFALYPTEDEPDYLSAPLQKGIYVLFDRDVYGQAYKLDDRGVVWSKEDKRVDQIKEPLSYIVFIVTPKKIIAPETLDGQKIATLLSQIQGRESNDARPTMDFLKETVGAYSKFNRLKRFYELKGKNSRTTEEENLMLEIKDDPEIKPLIQ